MFAFATLLTVLALAQSALAGVYVTAPVTGASVIGGQTLTVRWADDGNSPSVSAVGPCSVDVYVGSKTSQFKVQNLAASVDVSKTSSLVATIDPSIGTTGTWYFVRFTSLGLKDSAMPQYNYQAYSARFTLNGMTGTFNQTVQDANKDVNALPTSTSALPSSTAKPSASGSAAVNVNAVASGAAASASSTGKTSAGLPTLANITPALMAILVGTAAYVAL